MQKHSQGLPSTTQQGVRPHRSGHRGTRLKDSLGYLYLVFFYLFETGSLNSPGYLETHYVEQAGPASECWAPRPQSEDVVWEVKCLLSIRRALGPLHHVHQAWWDRLVIPGTREMEARRSQQIWGQPGLHDTLSQKKNKQNPGRSPHTGHGGPGKRPSGWLGCLAPRGITIPPPNQGRERKVLGFGSHSPQAGGRVSPAGL